MKKQDATKIVHMADLCADCGQQPQLDQAFKKWRVVCQCGNVVKPRSNNKTLAVYRWNILNKLITEKNTTGLIGMADQRRMNNE